MKVTTHVFILLLFISFNTAIVSADNINLSYKAETYAYSYALAKYSDTGGDSDTAENEEMNSKSECLASAFDSYDPYPRIYQQNSHTQATMEGISDAAATRLVSRLKGWGLWNEAFPLVSGPGGGNGNGNTYAWGGLGINCPEGWSDLTLSLEAKITGDAPEAWDDWDWHFSILESLLPSSKTLLKLDDNNMTANLAVLPEQTFGFEFYHEAGRNNWPETGLDSTVEVNLNLVPEPCTLSLLGLGGLALLRKRRA